MNNNQRRVHLLWAESIQFDDLRTAFEPFIDNTVLFVVSDHDLQYSLGWFAAKGKWLR